MELKEIEKANTKYLGKKVIYYEEIESTHKKAKELATSKTENGTIIIADKQTGGIGTKGRRWYTGNNNIAMTIIIYPVYLLNRKISFLILFFHHLHRLQKFLLQLLLLLHQLLIYHHLFYIPKYYLCQEQYLFLRLF